MMMPQLQTENATSTQSSTCTTGPVPIRSSNTPGVLSAPEACGITELDRPYYMHFREVNVVLSASADPACAGEPAAGVRCVAGQIAAWRPGDGLWVQSC